jgi:hypothetical protein
MKINVKNSIVFPYQIHHENRLKYAYSVELAKEMDVDLILFTTIPKHAREVMEDRIFLHLLALNGYYQTYFAHWKKGKQVKIKNVIRHGDFQEQLEKFIWKTPNCYLPPFQITGQMKHHDFAGL